MSTQYPPDVQTLAIQDSRPFEFGPWAVSPDSTPAVLVPLPIVGGEGAIDIGSGTQAQLADGQVIFLTGSMQNVYRIVKSVTASGALTLDNALPAAPPPNSIFVVRARLSGSPVSTSTDIAQVGGTTQTGADWTGLLSAPNTSLSTNEQSTLAANTATKIVSAVSARRSVAIFNNNASGGATIYIGGADTVTTASGYPVAPQGNIAISLGPALAVWAIATSSSDVRVLELA